MMFLSSSKLSFLKAEIGIIARKLNFLTSVKESYERKLAGITASISKLEEQMNSTTPTVES